MGSGTCKSNGADKSNLIRQFMAKSFMLTRFKMLLALIIVYCLPSLRFPIFLLKKAAQLNFFQNQVFNWGFWI